MDNSGPAFPAFMQGSTATDFVAFSSSGGMTLRDYFAGQAIIGILAADDSSRIKFCGAFAIDAYAIADAMLAKRSKE